RPTIIRPRVQFGRMKRATVLFACLAASLGAHPMGNFSVSHYSRIVVDAKGAAICYALDLAEVPAAQLFQQWGLSADSPRAALDRRAEAQAQEWINGLSIEIGGRAVTPRLERATLTIEKSTLRIAADVRIDAPPGSLRFEDRNYRDRSGWKEI